ncbi:MAG: hypothetical protein AAGF11_46595 [Myxococcota bacterium]
MSQSNNKRYSILSVLALIAVIEGAPAATAGELTPALANTAIPASTFALIPTQVDNPPAYNEPDGTCSMCIASTDGAANGDSATIEIYFEDDGEDFSGDFRLTLLLDDSSTVDASIDGVSISHQETRYYTVNAGSGWDWDDVTRVNIEALPDA